MEFHVNAQKFGVLEHFGFQIFEFGMEHYPHFVHAGSKTESLSDLPKVIWLVDRGQGSSQVNLRTQRRSHLGCTASLYRLPICHHDSGRRTLAA
jgi:hypothetical protein